MERHIKAGSFHRIEYQTLASTGYFAKEWFRSREQELDEDELTREELRQLVYAERLFNEAADMARTIIDKAEVLEQLETEELIPFDEVAARRLRSA